MVRVSKSVIGPMWRITVPPSTNVLEKGLPNETYNISSHQEYTNIEIIQAVCNAMGSGHELISFVEEPPRT